MLSARKHAYGFACAALAVTLATVLVGLSTSASARPNASLAVSFNPYRLGANTTLSFAIDLDPATGQVSSPVTSIGLRLPAGLGLFTSTLGETVCRPSMLQAFGVAGCSPNAVIGHGHALVIVPLGSEHVQVPIKLTVMMAPLENDHTTVLLYAEAESTVIADLVFPGTMVGAARPFGTLIDTSIPPITSLPEAPSAALTKMQVTIGPQGVVYKKRVDGRSVPYRPTGMAVPERCPPEGFPFEALIGLQDHTTTIVETRLACPSTPSSSRRQGAG